MNSTKVHVYATIQPLSPPYNKTEHIQLLYFIITKNDSNILHEVYKMHTVTVICIDDKLKSSADMRWLLI
jgi:hypothetical protein